MKVGGQDVHLYRFKIGGSKFKGILTASANMLVILFGWTVGQVVHWPMYINYLRFSHVHK